MANLFRLYRNSFAGLPADAWWLAAVMLVNRSGSMVLFFLTLYLTQDLGWSDAFAGYAIASYGLGSCVGAVVGGRLTEAWGPRRVQLLSLVATAACFVLLSNLRTASWLLSGLFTTGVVAEALRPANAMAVSCSVPLYKQARAFALNRLALNLGFTLGPAIGGFLATLSYRYLFFMDASTCIAAACLLLAMPSLPQSSGAESEKLAEDCPEARDERLTTDREHVVFVLGIALLLIVFMQVVSTYPLFLREHVGLREQGIGLLMAVNTIVIVLVEMPLTERIGSLRPMKAVAWGSLFVCAGFGLLPLIAWLPGGAAQGTALIIMVLIWTVGEMISMPAMFTHVTTTSSMSQRPRRLAGLGLASSTAFVVAPLLGTTLYRFHPDSVWLASFAAAPFLWYIFRGRPASSWKQHAGPNADPVGSRV
ncbi:MAG: MFS transporter [Planctomycetota bacterium]